MDDNLVIQLRLEHSYLLRHLKDDFEKYQEGLRLIEQAEFIVSEPSPYRYGDALIDMFEGLGWLRLSGITKSGVCRLAVERVELILGKCNSKKQWCQDFRLSDEQQVVYGKIAEAFFAGDALDTANELIAAAGTVVGWVVPR